MRKKTLIIASTFALILCSIAVYTLSAQVSGRRCTPADYERTANCPHCGARYFSGTNGKNGQLTSGTCQNTACGKDVGTIPTTNFTDLNTNPNIGL